MDDLIRVKMREALEVEPPDAELRRRVFRSLPIDKHPRRRESRWHQGATAFGLSARALQVVAATLLLALLVSTVVLGRLLRESNTPGGSYGLTPTEQSQLAELEARPLHLPAPNVDGSCPDGPRETIAPRVDPSYTLAYGTSPVWGEALNQPGTERFRYFAATYYTAPKLRGPVLIRGGQRGSGIPIVFVGPYSAGPVVATDVIDGTNVDLREELVLPASRPPKDPYAAPGWGIWNVHQGVSAGAAAGCWGMQFDTLGSSVVVGLG